LLRVELFRSWSQIKEKCEKLLSDYERNAPGAWQNDDQESNGLATQALLFALLFEVRLPRRLNRFSLLYMTF